MTVNDIFQLGWINVVTGSNDHSLDSLAEIHKTILIHPPQIAGVEPDPALQMAAEGLRRLLGVVHIAQHHCRTGDANFTVSVGRQLLRGARLHNFVVCIGERHADGARAGIILGGEAGGSDALCGAVALPDLLGAVVFLEELIHFLF